jgi:hypothetical protein
MMTNLTLDIVFFSYVSWTDTCFIFFRDSSAVAIFSETVFSSSDRVAFSFFPVY